MDCAGCQKNCCKSNHLVLSVKDLNFFQEKIPDLKFIQYGPFVILNESCPFYDEEKADHCTIYEHRPNICRLFPFDYRGQLYRCNAGDTVTQEDKLDAFNIIHAELPRMWDDAYKYPKELAQFNKKIGEIKSWQQ
jgi:Fe-S-cluster containining protein